MLLHYIWQQGIFMGFPQQTTDGRKVVVLSVGQHNLQAGPDFTNVHLRIYGKDETTYEEWAGTVEIHVRSSDWYKHHHHQDAAYDRIILHVVRKADKKVYNTLGEAIAQMELNYPDEQDYLQGLLENAQWMDSAAGTHACAKQLLQDPQLLSEGWKKTLLEKRLMCKQDSVQRLLALTTNDHEQALYITLAHHMGFHVNGIPMEQVAIATPLAIVRKHRSSLVQIEALLLGQAGLITEEDELLKREYTFLQTKFGLTPIEPVLWKRGRMRPQTFPEVRLRQMAKLLVNQEFLFSRIMETEDIEGLRDIFAVTGMGRDSVDSLLINVVVPMKFANGKREQALRLLEQIPMERNRIVRQWQLLGQKVKTAADSQALIHLYMTYCQMGKCMNCDVAYQIFLTHKAQA